MQGPAVVSSAMIIEQVVLLPPPHPIMSEGEVSLSGGAPSIVVAAPPRAGALEQAGSDPFGWGGPCLAWGSQADPEVTLVLVLDDIEEQDFWDCAGRCGLGSQKPCLWHCPP